MFKEKWLKTKRCNEKSHRRRLVDFLTYAAHKHHITVGTPIDIYYECDSNNQWADVFGYYHKCGIRKSVFIFTLYNQETVNFIKQDEGSFYEGAEDIVMLDEPKITEDAIVRYTSEWLRKYHSGWNFSWDMPRITWNDAPPWKLCKLK